MGDRIRVEDGNLVVPDRVAIPFIEGDGTGPDIWRASVRVFDAAVRAAYGSKRSVDWIKILAGKEAYEATGEWLPDATLQAISDHVVAIKGPLTTPVGGGIRSLNVTLRQVLELYACVRPVRWFPNVPCPVVHPEQLNVVIFRENMEDVYAGIEFPAGSQGAKDVIDLLTGKLGYKVDPLSAIGIKPMSEFNSKRLIRKAIKYAISHNRKSVTLMHKGNIMKFTEGAFREWGYQVAKEEFGDAVVFENEDKEASGKVVIKDRIADNMFQQLLTRPSEYDVIATPNLNGDYLSDAAAAQVGGLGMAPGANMSDAVAVFEATHGTAEKYAGLDVANPGSLILSGAMMFDYIGWSEVADIIEAAMEKTFQQGIMTQDLARQSPGVKAVKTSEFADAIISNMEP
ncbi:MAG TPA: isocitrate dehydrogenase (NADP(+)) [Clostridia bacterium]|nr:isocitrate dehydrogenase (NADP(+)) [Clostridia bacterium]